jgi:hypothetical protein
MNSALPSSSHHVMSLKWLSRISGVLPFASARPLRMLML